VGWRQERNLEPRRRPIDHVVLPVTTLMLARSRLTGLGFTVAPDAKHPFGTGNCCIFFKNRTFVEPVTILDRRAADVAAAEGVFFVRRLKRFTERHGEGFAMLALRSADADADRAAILHAGIEAPPKFHFARTATLPDGSEGEVGFDLIYADSPASGDATIFLCRHLAPDVLFQPAYVEHANCATGIAAVTAVAENPADFHILLSAMTGERELRATSLGVEAKVDDQTIAVLTRVGFQARYGVPAPDLRRGLLFAAVELSVPDLDHAIGFGGPTAMRHEGMIVVPPSPGLGAVVAFRTDANG
jgi:hypothetical protein